MATTTKLKVDHYGINISDEKLRYLDLKDEYLIVGEKYQSGPNGTGGFSNNEFAMIVDNRGVAINCSLLERNDPEYYDYSGLIKGNLRVLGNIEIDGFLGSAACNEIIGGSSNFWKYSDANNIYYDGSVTVGTLTRASNNNYAMNLAVPAYRNITRAQLSINNNNSESIFRCGILGNEEESPVVFNTRLRTPIEFHINKDTYYFNEIYKRSNINQYFQKVLEPTEIPDYRNPNALPNLVIDYNGKVGINTNSNVTLTFNDRLRNQPNPNTIAVTELIQPADLHVNGTMYATNILMYDIDLNKVRNIEDIFIRDLGEKIFACNITPGTFGQGDYTFPYNIGIGGTLDPNYALTVNGASKFTSNVNIEDDLVVNNINVHNSGAFSNNIEIQNNIYFKGNLFKQLLNSNTGCNEWSMIQFDHTFFQTPAMSNIFYIGDGIATPGKFGAGINVNFDEVNHQVTINKRDPSYFELELLDKSIFGIHRGIYIGHPNVTINRRFDGSTIFLTPGTQDENYNRSARPLAPQNMYFYPGWSKYISQFELNDSNIPTFGIFYNHRVGINTFSPTHELDVNGDIAITGNYYLKYPNEVDPVKLGVWRDNTYSYTIGNTSNIYKGIQYYNPEASHVGINTIASYEYGLSVTGKIVSFDGYYTSEGYRHLPIYNGYQMIDKPPIPYDYGYFNGKVGVGVIIPQTALHLRDTGVPTALLLSQSLASTTTYVQYLGNNNSFLLRMDDARDTFELYQGNSNLQFNLDTDRPWLIHKKPDETYQMVINSNLNFAQENSSFNLLLNGNMRVVGDIDITGNYKVSGSTILIGGSQAEFLLGSNIEEDSIILSANNIFMNTDELGAILIGFTGIDIPPEAELEEQNTEKSAFYLKQTSSTSHYVTKYETNGNYCMSEYESATGDTHVIGITPENTFFVGKNVYDPYITVSELITGEYVVGIGTNISSLNTALHIYSYFDAQQLLNLTHYSANPDTADFVSGITLEKIINGTEEYKWIIQGPNQAYQQKLQFIYNDPTSNLEIVTITKDGCIGIGNTTPTFAVDIQTTGDRGGIRMYQTDSNIAKPQLLFQTGDPTYGIDESTDYRIYAYQNNFYLDMQKISTGQQTLFHFASNTALGILQEANTNYEVSIGGSLNVEDSIYINGKRLFSYGDEVSGLGLVLTGCNIFLLPDADQYGGIVINGSVPSCNIFQINNGVNGNLMVLDSEFSDCQIHFRNVDSLIHRIWRIGVDAEKFIMEHYDNAPSSTFIDDSHNNYIRASEWYSIGTSNYKQVIFGSVELDHEYPEIIMNNLTIGSDSNLSSYILSSNLSIGTKISNGQLHVSASSYQPTIVLSQYTQNDILRTINIDSNITNVINHLGNVGIGTTIAHDILTVYNGNTYMDNDLRVDGSIYLTNELNIQNGNFIIGNHSTVNSYIHTERLGISTSLPSSKLDIKNNIQIPAVSISQYTSYNILQLSNVNSNISLVVDSVGNVGIGTTTTINKGLYVTGNTQLDGTLDVYGLTTIYGQFLNPSDIRIKTDIQPITNALDIVKQINGYSFTKLSNQQKEMGVIAQELQKILPDLVHENNDGYLSVSYLNLIALLIEAIKELDAKIELKR